MFTKEELEEIIGAFKWYEGETSETWNLPLQEKIQSMIDNYCDSKLIAKSHLKEASSLISHAMGLLDME